MAVNSKKLTCEQAEMHYYEYLSTPGSLLIPEEILEHIKHCNKCIKELDALRELLAGSEKREKNASSQNADAAKILQEHFSYAEKKVTCSDVKPHLPGIIDPSNEIKVPTPVTAHLHNCPDCSKDVKKIRSLKLNSKQLSILKQMLCSQDRVKLKHIQLNIQAQYAADFQDLSKDQLKLVAKTIYDIVSRKDSGITTVFKMTDPLLKPADELYSDYPVDVQVFNNSRTQHISLRKYLKPALTAVAAVIILAALFYPSSTATASMSLLDLYKTLGNLQTVHIVQYSTKQAAPIQEQILSRTAGYYAVKNTQNTVVWDVVRKTLTSKDSSNSTPYSSTMNEQQLSSVNATMKSRFGLVPFADISSLPTGTKWIQQEDATVDGKKLSVYSLEWIDAQSTNSGVKRKWQYFIDESAQRIYKIEAYQENIETKQLELTNTIIAEYPDESAIESYIDNFVR